MRPFPCLMLIATLAAGFATPALAAGEPRSEGTQVTEYAQGDARIQEYRIRGQLYQVKVIPAHGKPYMLAPADGSDNDLTRADKPTLHIPQWTLLQW